MNQMVTGIASVVIGIALIVVPATAQKKPMGGQPPKHKLGQKMPSKVFYKCPACKMKFNEAEAKKSGGVCSHCKTKLVKVVMDPSEKMPGAVMAKCLSCGMKFTPEQAKQSKMVCPHCKGKLVKVVAKPAHPPGVKPKKPM